MRVRIRNTHTQHASDIKCTITHNLPAAGMRESLGCGLVHGQAVGRDSLPELVLVVGRAELLDAIAQSSRGAVQDIQALQEVERSKLKLFEECFDLEQVGVSVRVIM